MPVLTVSDAPGIRWRGHVRASPAEVTLPEGCRAFVERMVAQCMVNATRNHPGMRLPDVDWASIWRAGDSAPSIESAVGRIVAAAYVAAREISTSTFAAETTPRPAGREALPTPLYVAPDSHQSRTMPSSGHALETRGVAPVVGPQHTSESVAVENPQVEVDAQPSTVPAQPSTRPRAPSVPGWSTVFTWIRNVGAVAILFVIWQLWGTSISQHHEQLQLQSTFEAAVHSHHSPPPTASGPALIAADQAVPTPAEGTPVAEIEIPTIGLNEYVVSGTAESDLAKGPGHYIGTAAPGQAGNVAIAGHRTTNGAPFNRLGQLAIGNEIYLTTASGERLTYVVSQAPRAVSPSDVEVLDNFGDNRITLTTCNPEYSSAQRLIVVGELKQPKPPVATKATPRAYKIVNSKTASWDWALLPVAVLEAGVLMLLGLSNSRFSTWFGGFGRWFILAPLWGAGLYVLFGTLTMLLPATI
jgi:LPXTG-site transpeptidase (sortase) family protein